MDTKQLIIELYNLKTKSDIDDLIETELNLIIQYFVSKGYNVNKNYGFVGKQELKTISDIFAYQYFRDLHFLYWGINGKWKTFDTGEEMYFNRLKGIFISIYETAKSI